GYQCRCRRRNRRRRQIHHFLRCCHLRWTGWFLRRHRHRQNHRCHRSRCQTSHRRLCRHHHLRLPRHHLLRRIRRRPRSSTLRRHHPRRPGRPHHAHHFFCRRLSHRRGTRRCRRCSCRRDRLHHRR